MSKGKILNELSDQIDARKKFTYSDLNFSTKEDAASFGEDTGKLSVAYHLIEQVNWMREDNSS